MLDAREFIEAGIQDGVQYETRVTGYLEYVARRLYFAARISLHDALAIEAGNEAALAKYGISIPPKSDFPAPKANASTTPRVITLGSVEVTEGGENEGSE